MDEYFKNPETYHIIKRMLLSDSDQRIFDYALDNKLSVIDRDWKQAALIHAGYKHPKIKAPKSRGRPKKENSNTGIYHYCYPVISDSARKEFWETIVVIKDNAKQIASETGNLPIKISDRKLAKMYACYVEREAGRIPDTSSSGFINDVKKYQRWINECKKELNVLK